MKNIFNKIKTSFLSRGISQKILIIISLLFTVLFLIWGIILMVLTHLFSRNDQINNATASLDSVYVSLNNYCVELQNIANLYASMPELQSRLVDYKLNDEPVYITSSLLSFARSAKSFVHMALYDKNGDVLDYISLDISNGAIPQKDEHCPLQRLMEGESAYIWEYIDKDNSTYMADERSDKLCLWRVIKNSSDGENLGAVALCLSITDLVNNCAPFDSQSGIAVINNTGRLVAESSPLFSKDELTKAFSVASPNQHNWLHLKISDASVYAVSRDICGTGLPLYNISNISGTKWINQVFLFSFFSFLFAIVFAFFPVYRAFEAIISRPLKKLNNSIRLFSTGDFSAKVDFKYEDEIGVLGNSFNQMVQKNEELIQNVYVSQIRKKEAELNALQAQINPHFLYNLISTIQWTAYSKGDEEIADMAYSMGQVFRISLNRGDNYVRVSQERELIIAYLKLQQKRFFNLVNYELLFDEDTLNVSIPKLIIQPIVENSVVHGIIGKDQPIIIQVTVHIENQRLIIRVTDDGVGIPSDILEKLPGNLGSGEFSSRFALRNINERLRLSFEDDYRFDITSEFGHGVSVTINIPVRENILKEGN